MFVITITTSTSASVTVTINFNAVSKQLQVPDHIILSRRQSRKEFSSSDIQVVLVDDLCL